MNRKTSVRAHDGLGTLSGVGNHGQLSCRPCRRVASPPGGDDALKGRVMTLCDKKEYGNDGKVILNVYLYDLNRIKI
jgi:hypothetical protein